MANGVVNLANWERAVGSRRQRSESSRRNSGDFVPSSEPRCKVLAIERSAPVEYARRMIAALSRADVHRFEQPFSTVPPNRTAIGRQMAARSSLANDPNGPARDCSFGQQVGVLDLVFGKRHLDSGRLTKTSRFRSHSLTSPKGIGMNLASTPQQEPRPSSRGSVAAKTG